jgi:hypothetical protein
MLYSIIVGENREQYKLVEKIIHSKKTCPYIFNKNLFLAANIS